MPSAAENRPIELLIYEPSFRRVRDRLDALREVVSPVLVDREGRLSRPDGGGQVSALDIEIAWTSPEVFIDRGLSKFMSHVLAAPRVRWLQSGSAGFDNPLLQSAMKRGIALTVNPAPANSIAEYVFATVLDHFQDGPGRREAQAAGTWRQGSFREIAGTVWLLVGFGAIGQRLARRAKAFDARVIGVNRHGGTDDYADALHTPDALGDHLPHADVVVLAVPLGPETQGLANADFFSRMKPGSVIVNVARGGILDEAALLVGLDRRQPGHAILDVFETEPLPPDSPLWLHPQITLTAHIAGMGSGLVQRSDAIFLENLRRYLAKEPLAGLAGRQ
jgi:phosphoglycerate dehydrogenase-like enzyme